MIALLLLLELVFAIIIVVVVSSLNSTIRDLRYELRKLTGRLDGLERSGTPAPSPLVGPHPSGTGPLQEPAGPSAAMQAPTAPSASVPSPPASSIPQPVPLIVPRSAAPARTQAEWETLIGGKFLNRIGALALIIGMGFFLKYAFDRNWISEWVRVGIGAGAGILLLVGGARFHRKGLPMFAQGLVGAGIAILYLSVYASFNYYQLVSQPVAFALMAAVTVVTFTQAFFYDALAVSLLGWLGGFLTPFLLSTGEAHPVALFSYIAILDLGLIAVLAVRRKWGVLAPLSLAATYIIYYLWYSSSAGGGDGTAAVLFLSIFWGLFHGSDVAAEMLRRDAGGVLRRLPAVANAVLFYPGFYAVVERYYDPWLAPVTLLLALLYVFSSLILRRVSDTRAAAYVQYVVTAIVLLVIATEIQFPDFVVIPVYVLEAVVLFWLGQKMSLKYLWGMGSGVLLWGCLVLLVTGHTFDLPNPATFVLLWNLRSLAFLSLACGAGIMLFLTTNTADGRGSAIRTILHLVWVCSVFLLLTLETADYFSRLAIGSEETVHAFLKFQRLMTMGLLWLVFGTLLFSAGHRRQVLTLAIAGTGLILLGTALIAVRGIAFDPLAAFSSILNIRVLILLLAAGAAIWCIHEMQITRVLGDWHDEVCLLLRILLVVVTLALISSEIRDYYEHAIALRTVEREAATNDLENLEQMFLSTGWLVYSIGLMGIGLLRRVRTLRMIAMVLFGIAILKIFFYDLSFLETIYRIVSFIGLGIILLTVSYLYQRYRGVILGDSVSS